MNQNQIASSFVIVKSECVAIVFSSMRSPSEEVGQVCNNILCNRHTLTVLCGDIPITAFGPCHAWLMSVAVG